MPKNGHLRPIRPGDDITAKWLNDTSNFQNTTSMQGEPLPLRLAKATLKSDRKYDPTESLDYYDALYVGSADSESNYQRVYPLNGNRYYAGLSVVCMYDRNTAKAYILSSASPAITNSNGFGCVQRDGTIDSILPLYNGHKFCANYLFGPIPLPYAEYLNLSVPSDGMIRLEYNGVSTTNQWISDPLTFTGPLGICDEVMYFTMIEEADGLWVYCNDLGGLVSCDYTLDWAFTHAYPATPFIDRTDLFRVSLSRTGTEYGKLPPPSRCSFFLIPTIDASTVICGLYGQRVPAEFTFDVDINSVTTNISATPDNSYGTTCFYATALLLGCVTNGITHSLKVQLKDGAYTVSMQFSTLGEYTSVPIDENDWIDTLESGSITLTGTSGSVTCTNGDVLTVASPLILSF